MTDWKLAASTVVLAAIASHASAASNYPDRPIRLVVPYAAGGSTDIVGRVFANKLSQQTGQSVVVENRPGASTNIGAAAVVGAPADGYTLLMSSSSLIANRVFGPEPSFHAEQDLKPVALIARVPYLLTARDDAPYQDASTLVEYGKAHPTEPITIGSGQLNSAVAMLKETLGLPLTHVGYRGGNPALTDLAAKQIHLGITVISVAMPLIETHKIKPLSVSGNTRMSALPNVPTFKEQGFDFSVTPWFAVHVPADVTADIRDYLEQKIALVVEDPEFKQKLIETGSIPVFAGARELDAMMAAELQAWKQTKANMKE